jgi:hypothetical protein
MGNKLDDLRAHAAVEQVINYKIHTRIHAHTHTHTHAYAHTQHTHKLNAKQAHHTFAIDSLRLSKLGATRLWKPITRC